MSLFTVCVFTLFARLCSLLPPPCCARCAARAPSAPVLLRSPALHALLPACLCGAQSIASPLTCCAAPNTRPPETDTKTPLERGHTCEPNLLPESARAAVPAAAATTLGKNTPSSTLEATVSDFPRSKLTL